MFSLKNTKVSSLLGSFVMMYFQLQIISPGLKYGVGLMALAGQVVPSPLTPSGFWERTMITIIIIVNINITIVITITINITISSP